VLIGSFCLHCTWTMSVSSNKSNKERETAYYYYYQVPDT